MKRIVSIALVFVLLSTAYINVSATNEHVSMFYETNPEFGYTYTKHTDSFGKITSSYVKDDHLANQALVRLRTNDEQDNNAYIKSVLLDLGMSNKFIDYLTVEKLDMYANAEAIITATSYCKSDLEGNVIIIDEDTALEESSVYNSRRVPTFPEDFGGDDDGETPTNYEDTETNNYMIITLTVAVLGNGRFHYSVDTTWLTPPSTRVIDSIGICVYNNTIVANTQSGWFNYYHTSGFETNLHEPTLIQNNFNPDTIECIEQNDWLGVGFADYLPPYDDKILVGTKFYIDSYHDFTAHLEFIGEVNDKETESFFYATATYEHIKIHTLVPAKPDLEITINGTNSYISMSTIWPTDILTVRTSLHIHHVP